MAKPQQDPKLFTVGEANELIPTVSRVLNTIRKKRDELMKLEQKKAVEELSWLREDGTVSPKAKEEVERLDQLTEEATHSFEEELEQLNLLGAQLKDLDEGLIDFFADRGGELIYLCWKEGEDQIRYWHDLESGFAGRQPIGQL